MGSELEDALRAAAVAAAAMASPTRKKNRKTVTKRLRSRSRSESMASSEDDPVKRMAAFQKRMFDVGAEAASTTFADTVRSGDDVVKVQWKTKRKGPIINGNDNEDAVPQLTRAKVVATPAIQYVQPVEAVMTNGKKKNKKNKNKTHANKNATLPAIEIHVPPSQPPATLMSKPTPLHAVVAKRAPVTTNKTTTSMASQRNDDALEFSDPSDDDDDEETTDIAATAKTLVAAKVAARNMQQAKKVASVVKPTEKETGFTTTASRLKKEQVAQPKSKGLPINHAQALGSKQAALNGKNSDSKSLQVATNQSVKKPAATTAAKHFPSQLKHAADEDDDKWDLDALVQKTVAKKMQPKKPLRTEKDDADDSAAHSDDDEGDHDHSDPAFAGKPFRHHQMHLFSQLIDEAARERWELVEVGRLVRIFAAQWDHKKKKTARFLRRCCPELVSVDFLEGMNIALDTKQLLKIFERGSGTPVVVMNKIASAVENGNMNVRDENLQSFIVDQTQLMPTNRDILEFLMPLLESLSKVKDVGVLLKAICEHWHVDRTAALVQDILLTPVFDDLDGQPDVILEDLPALEGRLDFPSCMDDEDADENGNLKGLVVGEESDLGESDAHPEDVAEEALGEILSDDEDGNDSHAEDGVYEGETDSEEEREAQERLNPTKRRRSRFILDEADEDEDDEGGDDDENSFLDDEDENDGDDESGSSGDSSDDDEGASTKPQRKRLRKG